MSQKRRVKRSVKLGKDPYKVKLQYFVTLALQTGKEEYYKKKWEEYVNRNKVKGVITGTLLESKGQFDVIIEKIKIKNKKV